MGPTGILRAVRPESARELAAGEPEDFTGADPRADLDGRVDGVQVLVVLSEPARGLDVNACAPSAEGFGRNLARVDRGDRRVKGGSRCRRPALPAD